MKAADVITSLLMLFAGVGVFLTACDMMCRNLQSLGGEKLKPLIAKAAKNKLAGVTSGAVFTAAVQSSSAATVTVIGLINAGVLTLSQAACVIFGANIGTTVTGQIVALGMFNGVGISSSAVFSAFAGVGAFTSALSKNDNTKRAGEILCGFGMIFVGLTVMGGAMTDFAAHDGVKSFLARFENPVLAALTGAAFTALIQSSSVTTSMTITMVASGLISLNQGIYIALGANAGTCVTALIAATAYGADAKRAALIHLLFNVGGAAVFLLAGIIMRAFSTDYGYVFAKIFPDAPQTQLAMFHTFFNVVTVILVLPFTDTLVKLAARLIPQKKERI